jgi:hypothetical protein
LHIPYFCSTVISARKDESFIELQACDGIVVCTEPFEALHGFEVEDNDSTVGTAGSEYIVRELELAD